MNKRSIKVTVCELSDKAKPFKKDWERLVKNVTKKKSDLVLLNELPFGRWLPIKEEVDEDLQAECIGTHEEWKKRIPELGNAIVIYSKPEFKGSRFLNTAYYWTKESGHVRIRSKKYFPNEPHFYEKNWFQSDNGRVKLKPVTIRGLKIGVLLCTELWFTECARQMGKEGMDILVCPRATGYHSRNLWIRCGQHTAVASGAFCLSSNRSGDGKNEFRWGGAGWVISPKNGRLLTKTSSEEPVLTYKIDLSTADEAKLSYPVYV